MRKQKGKKETPRKKATSSDKKKEQTAKSTQDADQKVILTPKRSSCTTENFGLDDIKFNMDSPFLGFCDQMLSPITPSQNHCKNFAVSSIGSRSPLNPSNWTPDLLALFGGQGNGKHTDLIPAFDGTFLGGSASLEKAIAESKEPLKPTIPSAPVVETKKEDSKKKRGGRDTKASKAGSDSSTSRNGLASKNSTKGGKNNKHSPATAKNDAASKKRNKSSRVTDASAKFTTPQPVKKTSRCPSRCLDFGIPTIDQKNGNGFSPEQNQTPPVASNAKAKLSDLMPKTPCDPPDSRPSTTKRRRASCAGEKCNCKKSKCLKLYCECFAAGRFCSKDCLCQNCGNLESNKAKVEETRKAIMQRDPLAFQPKILNFDDPRHKKGCHCKRSHCLKKYCECFQANIRCSELCKCVDCHNRPDNFGGTGVGLDWKKGSESVSCTTESETKKIGRSSRGGVGADMEVLADAKKTRMGSWTGFCAGHGPTLLKRVAPSTPSQKKTVFEIRGRILRPPPSPLC